MAEFVSGFASARRKIKARIWLRQVLMALAAAAIVGGMLAIFGLPLSRLAVAAAIIFCCHQWPGDCQSPLPRTI